VSDTSLSPLYTKGRRKQKCSIIVAFHEVRNTGNVSLPCMLALYLLNFSSWTGLQVTYSTIWFSAQCSVAFLHLCTTSLLRPAHTKIALAFAFNQSINSSQCCLIWSGMNLFSLVLQEDLSPLHSVMFELNLWNTFEFLSIFWIGGTFRKSNLYLKPLLLLHLASPVCFSY
jgi:hypothetical protein